MAEFVVKVADERGHLREHVENAASEAEARSRFVQQGLYVQSVQPRGLLAGGSFTLPWSRRVRAQEFVVFNQQFYTLIHAGLPIVAALALLQKRQRNPYFASILKDVMGRVRSGTPLSEAFAAQSIFPRLYTTNLLAGEKSGNLEEVLTRYVAFQRVALSVRKKLLSSLIYPALLVVLVTGLLTFLITYVVPEFGKLYDQLDAQLPPLTLFMLNVGRAAQTYALAALLIIIVLAVLFWRWIHTPSGAERVDRIRLATPILGGIWLRYQVAMFARMLATLQAGGLPLVPSLETAGSSMESRRIATAVAQAALRVSEGQPLAQSLEQTGVFPELAVEMIEVGESTGALRPMLNSVAEFFEEDVQNALTAAMALIEPLLLIFMGTVVAFVLLSLYLPIFSLGAKVGH